MGSEKEPKWTSFGRAKNATLVKIVIMIPITNRGFSFVRPIVPPFQGTLDGYSQTMEDISIFATDWLSYQSYNIFQESNLPILAYISPTYAK